MHREAVVAPRDGAAASTRADRASKRAAQTSAAVDASEMRRLAAALGRPGWKTPQPAVASGCAAGSKLS